jgi:nucleotide-binding universal stress UspA family protein
MRQQEAMRVLLAVDASPCSDAAVEEIIRRFARGDTHVRVVHAVEWMKEMPLAYQFGQGATAGRDAVESRRRSFERAEALVNRVAARLERVGFHHVSVATPDADPRHGIVDEARAWKPELIVMGSHGRHGLDRLLLGSVAEAVLRHAPCSVEIVREPVAAEASLST